MDEMSPVLARVAAKCAAAHKQIDSGIDEEKVKRAKKHDWALADDEMRYTSIIGTFKQRARMALD